MRYSKATYYINNHGENVGINSMQNMMNFGFGYGFGFTGWIFMILWWAFIIFLFVAIVKWIARESRGDSSAGRSAIDILKERYAKGEIDRQEFEQKKKDLS